MNHNLRNSFFRNPARGVDQDLLPDPLSERELGVLWLFVEEFKVGGSPVCNL
jgi:hypothetical protein